MGIKDQDEEMTLDYPDELDVITKILIGERRESQSKRRV